MKAARFFARGLTRYATDDARRIVGTPTAYLAAALGRENVPHDEMIHRDSLVLLPETLDGSGAV